MQYAFMADEIVVLRFSGRPDRSGQVIPPNVKVTFPQTIRITYGEPDVEHVAGHARLRRMGDALVADMVLYSRWKDNRKADGMIKRLYPAVAFDILQGTHQSPLAIQITELFLTTHRNCDEDIEPLGDRLRLKRNRNELH